eukprot:SAG11_NODE_1651_length_4509_cov_3.919274_4_plen_292_part_00
MRGRERERVRVCRKADEHNTRAWVVQLVVAEAAEAAAPPLSPRAERMADKAEASSVPAKDEFALALEGPPSEAAVAVESAADRAVVYKPQSYEPQRREGGGILSGDDSWQIYNAMQIEIANEAYTKRQQARAELIAAARQRIAEAEQRKRNGKDQERARARELAEKREAARAEAVEEFHAEQQQRLRQARDAAAEAGEQEEEDEEEEEQEEQEEQEEEELPEYFEEVQDETGALLTPDEMEEARQCFVGEENEMISNIGPPVRLTENAELCIRAAFELLGAEWAGSCTDQH